MAKIIDFPKKKNLFFSLTDVVTTDSFGPLSVAHRKAKEMYNKLPYILSKLSPDAKEKAESLVRKYDERTFVLLKRIMVLEQELFIEREKDRNRTSSTKEV